MSNLTGTYELSLWQNALQSDATYKEFRYLVIGANDMISQSRALEPKLVTNVNGSKTLTFKMYYQYIDNITGEKIDNIFTKYLINESKLKLHYQNKWYEFIIKTISENSADKSFTYSAIDYHINELSKNGFGLTLDTNLENNIGTVGELGATILKDTDWKVKAERIPQTLEEALVEVTFAFDATISNVTRLLNSNSISPTEQQVDLIDVSAGEKIYIFYSCLKNEADRLQFIWGDNLEADQDRVIITKDCQYYIDNVGYAVDTYYDKLGLKKPALYFMDNTEREITISTQFRGDRYVFSRKVLYNELLDKYVTEYIQTNQNETRTWHCYQEEKYEAPILIQNWVTNSEFTNTLGWTGQYVSTMTKDSDINDPKATNANKLKDFGVEVTVSTDPDLKQAIVDGNYNPNTTYVSYLLADFKKPESILINSGFYDIRKTIGNLHKNQKFVLLFKLNRNTQIKDFTVTIGEKKYLVGDNCYLSDFPGNADYLTFTTNSNEDYYTTDLENYKGYRCVTGEVSNTYNLSEIEFLAKTIQIFITPQNGDTGQLIIEDFQIFPYVEVNETFMLPDNPPEEAKITTEYYYFDPNSEINKTASSVQQMQITKRDSVMPGLHNSYVLGAEKSITLSIKQSNYFNAIQSLCEVAQCWAEFEVNYDNNGNIVETTDPVTGQRYAKRVVFKNFIGKENYAGFRYGVNLNQITRQIASNTIVTKLIVPDNANTYAKNGFCSIARGGSNETGENFIYDFSYYVNKQMLDQQTLASILYLTEDNAGNVIAKGPDINEQDSLDEVNHLGYYTRLSVINQKLNEVLDSMAVYSIPLTQALANVTTYENGYKAAEEEYKEATVGFLKVAGFEYTDVVVTKDDAPADAEDKDEWATNETTRRKNIVENNSEAIDYFNTIITSESRAKEFQQKLKIAKESQETYESQSKALEEQRDELLDQKEALNLAFYKVFARYIQEGTWKDDNEIDDEKYYINAQSVAYNSSKPQIVYTINVMELSSLPGYENFKFELADQTWIEDTEYFGYDSNGMPIREKIVLTEITYNLDDPSQVFVKVQNFKTQFQDLFQRITAQVQSTSYSTGAWNNAKDFVESTPQEQAKFLQDALNSAELVIQNAGNQSVRDDSDGLTITDLTNPSQQIRITGGAILLSDVNSGGQQIWRTGLTAKGINAQIITTGQLNTNNIQIMGGTEPHFRWDSYGITAYDFTLSEAGGAELITNYDTSKGIRFDRFGIYGFDKTAGLDGAAWKPKTLTEIKERSIFSLTWDGLFLKLGNGGYNKILTYNPSTHMYNEETILAKPIMHSGTTVLGFTDGRIYNDYIQDTQSEAYGLPYYNGSEEAKANQIFTKVLSITSGAGNEELAIYDDGTLIANKIKLVGAIEWTTSSSPSKSVYATYNFVNKFDSIEESLPSDGSKYSEFPDTAPNTGEWHKTPQTEDTYYAHTDNGGATWSGPFLLTGKSIVSSDIQYTIAKPGLHPEDFGEVWVDEFPVNIPYGQIVYIRTRQNYNNGESSNWIYSVSGSKGQDGKDTINCYIDSNAGEIFNENETSKIILTARIFEGLTEIDPLGNSLTYTWYYNNEPMNGYNKKSIEINPTDYKQGALYFTADDAKE